MVPSTSGAWCAPAAQVPAAAEVLVDEHVQVLADAVGGPLGHELVRQVGQVLDPAGDLVLRQLPRQAGRLGAVLGGVAEDADRVEPGVGQELPQLLDVVRRSRRGSPR